eukprot:scaffold1323_cov255-Pinguiococcus_pyrenoidosus.AAC.7
MAEQQKLRTHLLQKFVAKRHRQHPFFHDQGIGVDATAAQLRQQLARAAHEAEDSRPIEGS